MTNSSLWTVSENEVCHFGLEIIKFKASFGPASEGPQNDADTR